MLNSANNLYIIIEMTRSLIYTRIKDFLLNIKKFRVRKIIIFYSSSGVNIQILNYSGKIINQINVAPSGKFEYYDGNFYLYSISSDGNNKIQKYNSKLKKQWEIKTSDPIIRGGIVNGYFVYDCYDENHKLIIYKYNTSGYEIAKYPYDIDMNASTYLIPIYADNTRTIWEKESNEVTNIVGIDDKGKQIFISDPYHSFQEYHETDDGIVYITDENVITKIDFTGNTIWENTSFNNVSVVPLADQETLVLDLYNETFSVSIIDATGQVIYNNLVIAQQVDSSNTEPKLILYLGNSLDKIDELDLISPQIYNLVGIRHDELMIYFNIRLHNYLK